MSRPALKSQRYQWLRGFGEGQLIVANKNAGARDWNKYIEPYLSDLRFSDKLDLLDREKLERAYKSTLLPMLELAKNLGFSANWRFRRMPSKQQ